MTTTTKAMPESGRGYLPAAGHDWFLPLYDPFVKLLGGDRARRALLDQSAIRPGHHVLDIGCGTGTFVVLIKRLHPNVEVVGLDPDSKALARATRKAERDGVSIRFDQGFAGRLPYPDASFDRVFSSFMFHHLPAEEKEPTLREARRALKPGGSLRMLDFGGPEDVHGFVTRDPLCSPSPGQFRGTRSRSHEECWIHGSEEHGPPSHALRSDRLLPSRGASLVTTVNAPPQIP